jgi:hypothetical protein
MLLAVLLGLVLWAWGCGGKRKRKSKQPKREEGEAPLGEFQVANPLQKRGRASVAV